MLRHKNVLHLFPCTDYTATLLNSEDVRVIFNENVLSIDIFIFRNDYLKYAP